MSTTPTTPTNPPTNPTTPTTPMNPTDGCTCECGVTTNTRPLVSTRLNLPGKRQGKVRDIYTIPARFYGPDVTADRLLIVATDRISAFDVVLPTAIPGKGRMLTTLATFWLRWIEEQGLATTHLLSTDPADIPDDAFRDNTEETDAHNDVALTSCEALCGRITIGTRCRVLPIECVVRGYLEGSGWKDYQQTGSVCGVALPAGLKRCSQLPEPIFTPATKADQGHDENISFEQACQRVGSETMTRLRETSIAIYNAAARHARSRGIIIADTKFEFGIPLDASGEPLDTEPILIDEALTPDSSRFWPADQYRPGCAQPSFDKQFVREYLQSLVDAGKWNKQDPGPVLPDDVVQGTLGRYQQAIDMLMAPHEDPHETPHEPPHTDPHIQTD